MTEATGRAVSPLRIDGLSHVLLDIEGTTCPVSFVAGRLFPYATDRLEEFLARRGGEPTIRALRAELEEAWRQDQDPRAKQLWAAQPETDTGSVLPYLRWLIQQDRKVTPLKELQGLVWAEGYANGDLIGPLFPDVGPALRRWHNDGLGLAVYSSGSVAAQQLLYRYSNGGDLRHLFQHWFDTRIGNKLKAESYGAIAVSMAAEPQRILFVSDAIGELEAAEASGMRVLFSDREGNPERDPGRFQTVTSYGELLLNPSEN
jgi:enolase-phosphatase E1